jgi:hypothetical protein
MDQDTEIELIVDSYCAGDDTDFTLQQSVSLAAASFLLQLLGTECPTCDFASSACAGAREKPQWHRTFGDNTLKMRTGEINTAITIDSAKLARSVSACFLDGREPMDLRDKWQSATSFRQSVDAQAVVTAADGKGGHREDYRRPACT